MTTENAPAGWYPDPQTPGQQRYWDGSAWSEATQPAVGTVPAGAAPFGQQVGYGYAAGPTGAVADAGARLVAYLIDAALIFGAFVAVLIVGAILGAISDALGAIVTLLGYLGVVGGSIWYILTFDGGPTGQTIGKRQMNIRVVDAATGQPGIGVGRAFMRRLWQWLWAIPCYFGYWSIFTNPERITQYDKTSSTRVVKV
jgi:uncharacterized RDD family membrane protein YckC